MKKTLNLLLKSSFRNTIASWPIVVGLTLLIALLSIVISLMTSINSRVVQNYHALDRVSNKRDALINLQPSDFTGARGDTSKPNNVTEAQQYFIYKLEQQYQAEHSKYDFYWSRTEGRDFSAVSNGYNKDGSLRNLKIKAVAKTNPLVSTDANGKVVGVDQLAVSEGHGIQTKRQTVLDATFARENNIHIGDIIRVQIDNLGDQLLVKSKDNWTDRGISDYQDDVDYQRLQTMENVDNPTDTYSEEYSTYNWLQVVGFGESSDYTMPVIDQQSTLPNKKTEMICYVDPSQFGLFLDSTHPAWKGFYQYDSTRAPLQSNSTADSDAYYSLKFKDANFKASKSDISRMNADFIKIISKPKGSTFIYLNGDDSYIYGKRTSAIDSTLYIYHVISAVILVVVAVVVLFSIVLITKKQIDKTRSQIGIMKATGYYKRQIVWNYVTTPFITSLVGGIIGFVISQGVQGLIVNLFNKFFNLDITGWRFDWLGFIIVIVVMWFVICGISFGIAYWVMHANTLELLGAARASHMSKLGLAIKGLEKSPKIYPKMEASLLASNSGKMFSVTFIVLIATIIMTATFTLPTTLNKNKIDTFKGLNYKQEVSFQEPVYNNPYTFMRTWDPTLKDQNYQYTSDLQKITALPVDADGKGYDMNAILQQLSSGKLSSEYYDLEFDATEDKQNIQTQKEFGNNPQYAAFDENTQEDLDQVMSDPVVLAAGADIKNPEARRQVQEQAAEKIILDKAANAKKTGTPSALGTLTANMKMLSMYNVVLSNHYFKLISDWAIRDPFGWNILANQWPKYLETTRDMRNISDSVNGDDNNRSAVENSFLQLQAFYKTFSESVGLTVSRDYYDYSGVGSNAYLTKNYKDQIDLYNGQKDSEGKQIPDNSQSKHDSALSFTGEKQGTSPAWGDLLQNMSSDFTSDKTNAFLLSDGTNKNISINHILKGYAADNTNSKVDKYLVANPDNMTVAQMEKYIQDYLQWYGCYFSQRSGTAIVQAGYTRPPYFVQQYMKRAYDDTTNTYAYRFAFADAPYNPDLEQLGTRLNGEGKSVHGSKFDFDIYGIQNNNKFVNLRDTKGNNLVSKLFDGNDTLDQYGTAGMVINTSLAKKMNLKAGDEVDMNLLYDELDNETSGEKPVSGDAWAQPNIRLNQKNTDGFISFNDMDTFNTTVDGIPFTAGNTNLTNAPSQFYTDYLNGNYATKQHTKDQKFRIVGVHDGYGKPMAWVKNDDANTLAGYNQDQEYFWNTMFRYQFVKEFTKAQYKNTGYYFDHDLSDIGYQQWIDEYVNGTLPGATKQEMQAAQNIQKVFEGAYPIFNYKYSMSDDIGDLEAGMCTWGPIGDYSPIALNGGIANNNTYDGIGTSTILTMLPTKITKDILSEMTSVIMAVVIIIIVLVVVLAFIIIMLTTSLVISDNQSFISTMKVLGYSNTQVVDTILGMYAISIVAAFIVGFIVGWFMLYGIINNMALSGSMVLPLQFPAFLIFAVIAAVCGLYVITFALGFIKVSKSNPLDALKDSYM